MHQMVFVHTGPEEFTNLTSTVILDLGFEENSDKEIA